MNCPQCNTPMKQIMINDIAFDECMDCRGLWFERNRFENMIHEEALPEIGWMDIDGWAKNLDFSGQSNPLPCPKCRDTFLATVRDPQSAAEISLCKNCGGTWLGTGQFMNIIIALLDEANRKSAPEYVKELLTQAGDMFANPDSLPKEWRNFKIVFRLLYNRLFIDHPKLKNVVVGIQKSLPL